MKLPLILLLTIFQLSGFGQEKLHVNQKIYKISVARTRVNIANGYLFGMTDSSIMLTPDAASIRYNAVDPKHIISIAYNNIERVVVKRKGSVGRGILLGALVGLTTGLLSGFVIGDDPPCNSSSQNPFGGFCALRMSAGEKAVLLGGAGIVAGSGIGAIVGAVAKKRFTIGGQKEKFDEMRLNVMDKAYGKQKVDR